jgi:hypothetical protein
MSMISKPYPSVQHFEKSVGAHEVVRAILAMSG